MRNFLTGLVACAVVLCAGYGLASRNSVGTMSAASGPYVSGTVINVSQVNARFSDIENELTDSLSRSGKGGMTAALRTTDGTVASPAHSFTNEPGSGLYRIGASDYGFAVGGVKTHEWTSTGESVVGTLGVSDVLTQTLAGSATTIASSQLEPSLADGNIVAAQIGKSASANLSGQIAYTKNATAALSTMCLGMSGVSSTIFCVDGNSKATAAGALQIGSNGTAIGASKVAILSWTPGPITGPACVGNSVAVANLAFGDTCMLAPPSSFGLGAWSAVCNVTAAGVAGLNVCLLAGTGTPPAGTYTVRTFQAAN